MVMTKVSIVWFRQDLRLDDNPAFAKACSVGGAIVPVYIWAPQEEREWAPGGASRFWLHYSLLDLQEQLKSRGLDLVIRQGDSLKILETLIQDTQASNVFWNRRYEPAIIARDSKIKASLHDQGIEVHSFNANLLHEPWTIANKQNKPFKVFTPFWKNCLTQVEPPEPLECPKGPFKGISGMKSDPVEALQLLPKIHWDTGIKAVWKPGSSHAKEMLETFFPKIADYSLKRNYPDTLGTSRLSPYLHFGEISPRRIWHETKMRFSYAEYECFLREIGWREFAYHLLFHFPQTPTQPLNDKFTNFPWAENSEHLKAWQKGKTGYPIVDAGMRELWTTGWMHNRVRMIVGSFIVKDLLLPWQEGARWFWDTLVDADLASNTLGWQWVGGCGADAAPYFRVFNPITQGEKFDAEGHYIRKWIPELAHMPNKWIHHPWEAPPDVLRASGVVLGENYPKPLVDHAEAREKALAIYGALNP